MKISNRKESHSTAAPGDREASYKIRITALRERDHELTNEIIALEKLGTVRSDPIPADFESEAYRLLIGDDQSQMISPKSTQPVRDLNIVYHERSVVQRAIELGLQMLTLEMKDTQFTNLVARMDEWRKLVRQTAIAALELQKLNRARTKFKRDVGGQPSVPCDLPPRALLGHGDYVGDETYRFIQGVLAAGIMTKGEVDRYAQD